MTADSSAKAFSQFSNGLDMIDHSFKSDQLAVAVLTVSFAKSLNSWIRCAFGNVCIAFLNLLIVQSSLYIPLLLTKHRVKIMNPLFLTRKCQVRHTASKAPNYKSLHCKYLNKGWLQENGLCNSFFYILALKLLETSSNTIRMREI